MSPYESKGSISTLEIKYFFLLLLDLEYEDYVITCSSHLLHRRAGYALKTSEKDEPEKMWYVEMDCTEQRAETTYLLDTMFQPQDED